MRPRDAAIGRKSLAEGHIRQGRAALRQYARARLADRGEAATTAERHARHHLALIEQAEPLFYQAGSMRWLERIRTENENLRTAGLPEAVEPQVTALNINAAPVIISSIAARSEDDIEAVAELARYGVGGRNLRVFRSSADREANLLQQILAPALRSRNPQRRKEAVEALEAAGWQVIMPEGHVCCGRPLYDYGFLDLARRYLRRTPDRLRADVRAGVPVVGPGARDSRPPGAVVIASRAERLGPGRSVRG